MSAEILLTHSYLLRFDPKQDAANMPYPPLGTLYAAAVLREAGFGLRFCDVMLAPSEDALIPSLEHERPQLLVIYDDDFNYLNKMCLTRMREAAFVMSAAARARGIRVIVHGSDAADHAEAYLDHGADAVIVGEGERTLLELCRAMLRDRSTDLRTIPGLVFRQEGTAVRTSKRMISQELDSLPLPAWDLVEWERYRSRWMQHHDYFSVNMVTTRGCPYHCNWCAKPIYGQVYHSRSPEHVAEEMIMLQRIAAPDHIWFADDIFGLKPGWVGRFAQAVKERNVRIPFKIQSRADLLVREGEVSALRDAGCSEVWIGAESGSQKVLDAMEKGITLAQIAEARRLLREHRMDACFFLQFGYRGETMEDIRATIAMVEQLMPENIGISVSYPLPGTKFYDLVRSEMGEKRNWTDSDDLAMMYRAAYAPEFYKRLHRYVHKRFRRRQGLRFLKELLTGQRRPVLPVLRRIGLLLYYIPAVMLDHLLLQRGMNGR
ncbi:MAG: B12-binding domain-containing radical SAM protein [Bacteroidetes bacterium]|nr:B12-binding domain-containing radical SAM protein [Bacteroidota bacterium]